MREQLRRRRDEEGFTLIELLIVIIILAILATIVIFAVGTTTKNAAVAACKSTVKTVQTAIEAYKAQKATGTYPATLTVLTTKTGTPPTTQGPWLKELPTAKKASAGFQILTTSYTATTGTFTVTVKTGGAKSASTAAACTGA